MNLGSKPMFFTSSSASMKSGDGVSDEFPAGLRVLVVDDDPTCLRILEKMLKNCLYEVTKCNQAELALKYLRDNKNGFDIVISDVYMPDMDGFKLLELVGLEMDLPVIMMSADDSKNVVMKGVIHGACDYLTKPVRMEALKNIWQHVVRKRKHEWKEKDFEQSGSVEGGEQQQKPCEDVDYSSSANEGNNSKKRKDEEDDGAEEKDDTSTLKKPRVVWSVELHHKFMAAVNQLGIDKAVPKKILDLMKVPGLTRENVASHLQKYRLYLRRLSDASPQQIGLNNSFMGPPDATFDTISPLSGFDFQTLATGSQLPSQNLTTIQAAALGRSATKSLISVPLVDQRNIFNLENPRVRIGEGQQQQNNNGKLINLLHGIPTNMDSKQLAALHQSAQSLGNMNMQGHTLTGQNNPLMTQMIQFQPQLRAQSLNAINSNQVSNLPSTMGQSILSPAIPNSVLGRNGMDNVCGPVYTSISHPSNAVDFSRRQNTEFQSKSFSLLGNSSKGMLHDRDAEMKGPSTFGPNYDIFNELNQNMTQDWGMQNIRSTFEAPQHSNIQGGLGIIPSNLVQQRFSSNQKSGQSKNAIVNNGLNMDQNLNSSLPENALRHKAEKLPNMGFQSGIFPEHFGQEEDLMSELLKQQEGVGPVESEFGFGGYHLDNLPA